MSTAPRPAGRAPILAGAMGTGPVKPTVAVLIGGTLLAVFVLALLGASSPILYFVPIGLVVMGLLGILVYRRPDMGLLLVAVAAFLGNLVLQEMLILHVPVSVVSAGRLWQQLVLAVLLLRLVAGKKLVWTWPDRLAAAYLFLNAIYLVLPIGLPLFVRYAGFRVDAGMALLFLLSRHLPLPRTFVDRAGKVIVALGCYVAAVAFWNHFDAAGYLKWMESTGFIRYQVLVQGVRKPNFLFYQQLGGQKFLRAGSVFGSYLIAAFYLLVPIAVVIGRAVAGRARRWEYLVGALCVGAVMLTVTRSAIIAIPLMIGLAFLVARGRTRMVLYAVVGGAILLPVAGALGLGEHLVAAADPNSGSTAAHIKALGTDVAFILANPIGSGLGTIGPVAQRFLPGSLVAESWFFQLAIEIGAAGMLLYVFFTIATMRNLLQGARLGEWQAVAAFIGLAGLSVCGVVLHSFSDITVSWPIWMLAGLALRPRSAPEAETGLAEAAQAPSALGAPLVGVR